MAERIAEIGGKKVTYRVRPVEKTWTFFGHWGDDGELVIDHAVEGEHQDVREDDGRYEGGLWADTGTGRTIEEAEADARSEYEEEENDG